MARTGTCRSGEENVMHLAIRAVFIALVGIGLAQTVAAAGEEPTIPRVRLTDPSLAILIDRAATQSAMFQRLVATIQQSNGMVHIEPGACGRGVHACLLLWMETAASNRFLRIYIDRRRGDSDLDVMASIGHELQHAVEALHESGVTDGVRMYHLFGRIAPGDLTRFETRTAQRVGDTVRHELRATLRSARAAATASQSASRASRCRSRCEALPPSPRG